MADRTPNTRLEKWMAKIAGETVDITPKDRLETLLAKIAGESVSITPDDTLEYWLNQIAENGGGGGGSSDFTTAEVTLITTGSSGQCSLRVANVLDDPDTEYYSSAGEYSTPNEESTVLTVILYKGEAELLVTRGRVDSISGEITADFEQLYVVTGNCTINVTLQ